MLTDTSKMILTIGCIARDLDFLVCLLAAEVYTIEVVSPSPGASWDPISSRFLVPERSPPFQGGRTFLCRIGPHL